MFIYCVWAVSLIISDQEDESIWKFLAMENWLPYFGFKLKVLFHNSFWRKAE